MLVTTATATAAATVPAGWSFKIPRKYIRSREDLEKFHASESYTHLIDFVLALNASARGIKTRADFEYSPVVSGLVALLKRLQELVIETPITETKSRFGNEAFREWHAKMEASVGELSAPFTPPEAMGEVNCYLVHSFGHRDRLDYGTGHELNFVAWLYCLWRLGSIKESDFTAVTLRVFISYIYLMRFIQTTYWLEPAGSHGIWGLDDYHFLPFLFGSSQLVDHKFLRPRAILDEELVSDFRADYFYLDCIHHINKIKTESLQWHSPLLNDIAGVKSWAKINEGMAKMYRGEVLDKLPIIQHFLFGSLIPFPDHERIDRERAAANPNPEPVDETSMLHYHDPSNLCCYHRVPSVHAVAEAGDAAKDKTTSVVSAEMLIPFD